MFWQDPLPPMLHGFTKQEMEMLEFVAVSFLAGMGGFFIKKLRISVWLQVLLFFSFITPIGLAMGNNSVMSNLCANWVCTSAGVSGGATYSLSWLYFALTGTVGTAVSEILGNKS